MQKVLYVGVSRREFLEFVEYVVKAPPIGNYQNVNIKNFIMTATSFLVVIILFSS